MMPNLRNRLVKYLILILFYSNALYAQVDHENQETSEEQAQPLPQPTKTPKEFVATEEISADHAASYPADI